MAHVSMTRSGNMQAALRQIGANLRTAKLRIGIFADATTTDGKRVAEYATYNEFGTEHIPARPFMRKTISEHKGVWQRTFAQMLQGKASDPLAVENALHTVGREAVGHIQETISSNMPPDNAPSTKRKKTKFITDGRGRKMKNADGTDATHIPGTLVDTGLMRKVVSYEVNP